MSPHLPLGPGVSWCPSYHGIMLVTLITVFLYVCHAPWGASFFPLSPLHSISCLCIEDMHSGALLPYSNEEIICNLFSLVQEKTREKACLSCHRKKKNRSWISYRWGQLPCSWYWRLWCLCLTTIFRCKIWARECIDDLEFCWRRSSLVCVYTKLFKSDLWCTPRSWWGQVTVMSE